MTVIDFNAAAYLTLPKGFSVSATYSTPSKSYSNGRTSRISTTYSFGASLSHKNLNIGVSSYNFLHNPKWTSKDFLETAVYSDYTAQVSLFLDRSVVIRVSYLICNGKKKVRQQNELQEMNGPASGALPF